MNDDKVKALIKKISPIECIYISLDRAGVRASYWLQVHGVELEDPEQSRYMQLVRKKALMGFSAAIASVAAWLIFYWYFGLFPFNR
jgi:hypothetical protein